MAGLLAEHRGYRNIQDLPDLTLEQILAWADQHKERTGEFPTRNSGGVESADETWAGIAHSGWQSEGSANDEPRAGMDPADLDCESVDPGGDIHNAVCEVRLHYGGALPAPDARNPWGKLQRVCRREPDPFERQLLAHELAKELQDWVGAEITATRTDTKQLASPTDATPNQATIHLLNIYTNGLAHERIDKAINVLNDDKLTVDEKLWKIDELMPIPSTVSAKKLGEALGVTKTAVQNTSWYIKKRKGQKENLIGRRREQHRQRAPEYESNRTREDD